jgi:hypothetical protein
MSTTNVRSLKKIAAGATFAFLIATTLLFQHGESVANHLGVPKAFANQNANLGDALPGLLGNGFAPNLW